ncbi:pyridoxal phosphate-dependent aminotransferase [Sporomusa acidovorans]|uniref:Aminotransferase n=1 Tax=Sporomusa acidovorans (strain ATCC 49682 / DSM 3132 / Mol) TaxID=1123286 RepID=A0ABZ3IVX1_SPOA4|nr:aminotransferase class I/II-fold pyridoxal phosphate-dependent enzyme [Sporomusa acidovorans]OZC15292.1 methionine aminotransferase [Sporomusa acidovorans DSM 3132]SDE92215.1 aminotransferase [Sporomusa acidovorans]
MQNVIQRFCEEGYASNKARQFTESVIREMSRIAAEHNAINLAQGYPDFPAPEAIKQAAVRAITEDHNQYAITWGTKGLRDAIAVKVKRDYGVSIDPECQLTVCCGATEGMVATLLATVNPGDEVIIFEPFYENYGADVILCGAVPKYVSLKPPAFNFCREELIAAFSDKTKAIIINTPNNPTGKVFSREELDLIAELCIKYDVLAINDEIYEHILYDNTRHIPLWTLPGMADRTIAVNSVSKTFSVTGWRIGYVQASPEITASVRKVHDFLTVGAAAPLQVAAAEAFNFGAEYYAELAGFYKERRDYLLCVLEKAGFICMRPHGAYYIMADITPFGWDDDIAFAKYMASEIGVAVVPGSSFFRTESTAGNHLIRFCFCKKFETLKAAADRLEKLKIKQR